MNKCIPILTCLVLHAAMINTSFADVNQATYSGGGNYEFGLNESGSFTLKDAPSDVDYNRFSMLHDGSTLRLYYFKKGSNDTLYQFAPNGTAFEYGHNSIATLKIEGMPTQANPNNFAMTHNGSNYHLFMMNKAKTGLFQFTWEGGVYQYSKRFSLSLVPEDADLSHFGMLHDGSIHRLYFAKQGDPSTLYQFGKDRKTFKFGHNSIAELNITNQSETDGLEKFAMAHDGSDYHLFTTPEATTLPQVCDRNIVLMGYWPPSNEMLREWSTDNKKNLEGWKGENWEGTGYNVYSFFPEFGSDGNPFNNSFGSPGYVGTKKSDLKVDYQDTSSDFWRIVDKYQPKILITTSLGNTDGNWEVEAVEGGHTTPNSGEVANAWYSDGHGSEVQPTQSSLDSRSWQAISTYSDGNQLTSTLPMQAIVDDVVKLGYEASIDYTGTSGIYLSGFLGLHGLYYNSLNETNVAAGHIHVGKEMTTAEAIEKMKQTLRTTIASHPSNSLNCSN